MGPYSVYKRVLRFKSKYPSTVAWRLERNSNVVQQHLNPGEELVYVFCGQKNDSPLNFFETCVVALTTKRILIGRKRLFFGYFLSSITPDMFNDLGIAEGMLWGKVHIDTIKEYVTISNIAKDALREIETQVSEYMMKIKKKYKEETGGGLG